MDDILGTYSAKGSSYFGSEYDESANWVIEKSSDETKGNVAITTFFGMKCLSPIYATFNLDAGILTIKDGQAFDYIRDENENPIVGEDSKPIGYLMFACNGADFLNIKVPAAGNMSDIDAMFGYYGYTDNLTYKGWWNAFSAFSAVRTE